ncbi:MAG: c-type cytochrome [Amphritea sp.]|nr:c-type cytochrome [Amphritea sp.]
MNNTAIELVGFGIIILLMATLFLRALMQELAARERQRKLLAIALSSGVLAFGFKIGLVVLFGSSLLPPEKLLSDRHHQAPRQGTANLTEHAAPLFSDRWQALPSRAPIPSDNPPTPAKIALGEKLFFDKRLSQDNTVSCASCHQLNPEKGGADGLSTSEGIFRQHGDRNAPTVLNAAFQQVLFWDGRAASLEEQALGPLINPLEMGMPSLTAVEQRINQLPEYTPLFKQVFQQGLPIKADQIAKAIAAYERTLITPDSPYDQFVRGNRTALSEQQQRGMALFESSGCVHCHSGPNFSAASVFSSTSPYRVFPALANDEYQQRYNLIADKGLLNGLPNQSPQLNKGVWRVPSLRNVAQTAPYFHNGSVDTLEEAVRIMATMQLGKVISNASDKDRSVFWRSEEQTYSVAENRALSDSEISDIVAFLESLSGSLPDTASGTPSVLAKSR